MSHEDGQPWETPGSSPENDGAPPVPPTPSAPAQQGWAAPGGPPPAPDPSAHASAAGHPQGQPPQGQPGWAPPGGPPPAPPTGWAAPGGQGPDGAAYGGHGAAGPAYQPPYGMAGSGPYPAAPPAPIPGVVALRPLTLGDIFNGAFGYIRHNPKTVFGLAVIVIAIFNIVSAIGMGGYVADYGSWVDTLATDPSADTDVLPVAPWTLVTMYGGALLSYVGQVVLTGLLAAVVGLAVLGRKLTMGEAWQAVRGRISAVLLVALLLFLMGLGWTLLLVGVLAGAIVLGITTGSDIAGVAAFIGGFLAVAALGAWIWVRTSLAMPVAVLERLGPGRSLARSWRVTRGSWWRVFGILLLSGLIVGVVSGILSTPFSLVAMVPAVIAPGAAWVSVVGGAASFIGTVVSGALTIPFMVGVITLLYVDLRMRREGLDLKLQAAAQSGQAVDAGIYLPDPAPAYGAYPGPYPGPHSGGVPGAPA